MLEKGHGSQVRPSRRIEMEQPQVGGGPSELKGRKVAFKQLMPARRLAGTLCGKQDVRPRGRAPKKGSRAQVQRVRTPGVQALHEGQSENQTKELGKARKNPAPRCQVWVWGRHTATPPTGPAARGEAPVHSSEWRLSRTSLRAVWLGGGTAQGHDTHQHCDSR